MVLLHLFFLLEYDHLLYEHYLNNEDIHSFIDIETNPKCRITIADTDKGKELKSQINNLRMLIECYKLGLIHENKEYKYVKVYKKTKR